MLWEAETKFLPSRLGNNYQTGKNLECTPAKTTGFQQLKGLFDWHKTCSFEIGRTDLRQQETKGIAQ